MKIPETDTSDIYANEVNAHVSEFDFTLDFRVVHPSMDDVETLSSQVARIQMSPPMAKATMLLLQRLVQDYEAQLGVIPSSNDAGGSE